MRLNLVVCDSDLDLLHYAMGCSSSVQFRSRQSKVFSRTGEQVREDKPDITSNDRGGSGRKTNNSANIPEDVREILRDTWKFMSPNLTKTGLGVFKRIFEYSPEIKTLFGVSHIPDDEVINNPQIKDHASRFMNAVGASVDNLDHLDDTLSVILFALGKQHKAFPGFDSDYFDTFYMAMTAHWETVMGTDYTREVADAWAHLFAYMMEKLKEGYFSVDE